MHLSNAASAYHSMRCKPAGCKACGSFMACRGAASALQGVLGLPASVGVCLSESDRKEAAAALQGTESVRQSGQVAGAFDCLLAQRLCFESV